MAQIYFILRGLRLASSYKTANEAHYIFVQFFAALLDDSLPPLVLTIASFQIDAAISQVPLSASSQQIVLGSVLGTTSGKVFPSEQE